MRFTPCGPMNAFWHFKPRGCKPWAWRAVAQLLFSAFCFLPSAVLAQPRVNFDELRRRMVEEEIIGGGVKNERVIQAMRDTPRHEFVAPQYRPNAYFDMSLPIGEKQTIS